MTVQTYTALGQHPQLLPPKPVFFDVLSMSILSHNRMVLLAKMLSDLVIISRLGPTSDKTATPWWTIGTIQTFNLRLGTRLYPSSGILDITLGKEEPPLLQRFSIATTQSIVRFLTEGKRLRCLLSCLRRECQDETAGCWRIETVDQMDGFVLGKDQPSALDDGHHCIIVVAPSVALNYCAFSFASLNLQVVARNVARF